MLRQWVSPHVCGVDSVLYVSQVFVKNWKFWKILVKVWTVFAGLHNIRRVWLQLLLWSGKKACSGHPVPSLANHWGVYISCVDPVRENRPTVPLQEGTADSSCSTKCFSLCKEWCGKVRNFTRLRGHCTGCCSCLSIDVLCLRPKQLQKQWACIFLMFQTKCDSQCNYWCMEVETKEHGKSNADAERYCLRECRLHCRLGMFVPYSTEYNVRHEFVWIEFSWSRFPKKMSCWYASRPFLTLLFYGLCVMCVVLVWFGKQNTPGSIKLRNQTLFLLQIEADAATGGDHLHQ